MEPDLLDRLSALPAVPLDATAPRLRIVRLHVERLKSIRRLDLPGDGIAWDGRVPDLMMVGGVNGSGKTTLLNFIEWSLRVLSGTDVRPYMDGNRNVPFDGLHSWIDFEIGCVSVPTARCRFNLGVPEHPDPDPESAALRLDVDASRNSTAIGKTRDPKWDDTFKRAVREFEQSALPGLVYLPSEGRLLHLSQNNGLMEKDRLAEGLRHRREFVRRWGIFSTTSLEAQLFAARWADLNAKERGEAPKQFVAFDEAFRIFFGDKKRLAWSAEGQLSVEVLATNGAPGEYRPTGQHGLDELSAGEKQVLILASQLLILWKPGSLVLIDEPELHLHTHWQTRLWELIVHFQRTRGGQVIIATQSAHLFGLAPAGSAVLLGGEPL